jgi:hypothetical protein
MTSQVDKPPLQTALVDPETGRATRQFVDFLHRLWKRTSDPSGNAIADLEDSSSGTRNSSSGSFDSFFDDFDSAESPLQRSAPEIEEDEGESIPHSNSLVNNLSLATNLAVTTISANTTLAEKGIYVVDTAGVIVTMPLSPDEGSGYVVIKNTTGLVTLNGNGKNIMGFSSANIVSRYDTANMAWSDDQDEWFLV